MPYRMDIGGLTFDGPDPVTGQPVTFDGGDESNNQRSKVMKVQLETKGLTTAELIVLAQNIHTHLTGNANFAAPIPTLAQLQAVIDAAQTALDEANMAFDTLRMKRAERRSATSLLVSALEALAGYVQAASDGDEAKILSAGMGVKLPPEPVGPLPAPQNLRANFGEQEGTCTVEWERVYGARSYFVECANAATGPWNQAATLTGTRSVVEGLTSGAKYYFRVRALGTAGLSPWSDLAVKMAA